MPRTGSHGARAFRALSRKFSEADGRLKSTSQMKGKNMITAEARTAQPDPMQELGGSQEVKNPALRAFEEEGEQHEGYLIGYQTGEIDGYILENRNGEVFRLNATADLKQKLRIQIHREHYVIVTYK